jgi:protein DGCR14
MSSSLPKYGDYSLVPAAPSPSPSDLPPTAIKELMTWGTLLGTPRALGGDDSLDLTPNNFKISEPGRRDDIGRRLATNASKSMRERAQGFGTTPKGLAVLSGASGSTARGRAGSMGPPALPTPGSTTPRRRAEALTPAGMSLLQRSVLHTPERSGGLGLPRSAGTRSRGEVMERAGGWSSGSNSSRPARTRTW